MSHVPQFVALIATANDAVSLRLTASYGLPPDAHDIETLCKLTGARGKNRKATLLKAHEALKEAGCINDFTVTGDKIKIDPIPTEGQAIAALKRETKARKQRSKGLRKADDYLT